MGYPNGALTEIALVMSYLGQQALNVWNYIPQNITADVEAVHIAEAWWNHVKASYRALAPAAGGNAEFRSVRIRQIDDPAGDYAEFAIPASERNGVRSMGTSELMPPFVAIAARLTVASRATRPGQKRFPFLIETDQANGGLVAGTVTLAENILAAAATFITLGAPAAAVGLTPVIVRRDAAGVITANQPVLGYLVNPNLSTQNTRKFGRGA